MRSRPRPAMGGIGNDHRIGLGLNREWCYGEDHDDQITGCCPFRAADAGTQPALVCTASFEFSATRTLSSWGGCPKKIVGQASPPVDDARNLSTPYQSRRRTVRSPPSGIRWREQKKSSRIIDRQRRLSHYLNTVVSECTQAHVAIIYRNGASWNSPASPSRSTSRGSRRCRSVPASERSAYRCRYSLPASPSPKRLCCEPRTPSSRPRNGAISARPR